MDDLSYMKPAEPAKFGFLKDHHECDRIPKCFSFSVEEKLSDAIQVYLRLKPDGDLSEGSFLSLSEEETNSLLLKKKSLVSKFSFSYIFKPNATQEEIFQKTTEDNLRDFFNGKNAFIFTYGTSCSGKTFTIQGKKKNPGLIPRIVTRVFATLENSIDKSCYYCPERSVSVVELTENDTLEKCLFKEKLLSNARNFVQQHLPKNDDIISFEELEMLYKTSKGLEDFDRDNCVFSIWLSFAEIYNEKIYDLFDQSKDVRTPLTLSTDLDKRVFIKGLQHIHVTTLEEAYFLYYYGCCNRSINFTALNERSSRSHSIFTIKILGRLKESNNFFISSSFSVCDLAGTERFSKTRNYGTRMKESQSINSSFLVLNRCLKIIRENQLRDAKQVVPYRESKLTQLIGSSFTTHDTNLVMIVTVAQSQSLREETETSLKSSAIATEIKAMILTPVKKKKKTRFSSTFSHLDPGRGVNWNEIVTSHRNNVNSSSLPLQDSNLEVLRELEKEKNRRLEAEAKLVELEKMHRIEIESLVDELKKLREQKNTDSIRIKELEASKVHPQTKELELLEKQQEELYDKYMNSKADILGLQKKLRLLRDDHDLLKVKHEELESTCEELEDMLDDAKEEVEELQKENKELNEAVIAKDEALVLKDERISFLEMEINQLEDNLQDNAEERDVYDKLVKTLEDDLHKKTEEIKKLNNKLMESTKIYVAEIKLLQKNLKEQNCRESRRIKEKNGNIPILRIQDISLSDDDDDNLRTPVRVSQ
ncbi:kinesin-like protein KIF20B [Halyomorpha halys]|uniref:kinesin-like protein KIF20B n=1 Tax=Halyomorpha halys TaxID=286706 RepID=UPI0006D51C52